MSRRSSPPLPRGPVTVEIDGFTHGGEGVARIEGKAVFVPGTLPGERVRIEVTDDRARWARATLLEVLEPSPDRVTPPCPFVPECGGCDLQHAAPAAQRALKTQVVHEQLHRLGGVVDPPVLPCRAVGPDLGYRAQARLHADPDGRLGFHRAGTNTVVPIDRCQVLNPAAQALHQAVDQATGAEEVRLRRFHPDGDGAVVLHPGPGPLHLPDTDAHLLLAQPDGRTVAMRGDGHLDVEVDGLTFGVPALSFFQPGVEAAAALMSEVVTAAGDLRGALTWDLYAGVGLLSLALARAGAEVVAIEGDEAAVEAARRNAERNGLTVEVHAEAVGPVVRRARARADGDGAGDGDGYGDGGRASGAGGRASGAGGLSGASGGGGLSGASGGGGLSGASGGGGGNGGGGGSGGDQATRPGGRPTQPARRRRPSSAPAATDRPVLEPPDVVVLDPPRSGAGEQIIADLAALAPAAMVYVACDVAALARDTRHLAAAGYQLRRAAPLDLFPMTHHVEVVATFTPVSSAG